LAALIHYRTPLALAAGEALSAALTTLPISLYVMRGVRPRLERKLARSMLRYGGAMIPGMISAWLLVAANRYLLRALGPDQVQDVGLFSLVERFSSVMLLIGQALWLGWRRFAFHNMHIAEGPELLSRGLTLYFTAAGLGAVAISMLGPAAVHLMIDSEFAPAAALIAPMTLSALISVLGNPLRMGLIKENRSATMSLIIMASAVVTIVLAVALIPGHASAGAVTASLAGQLATLTLTWTLAQRTFYIPLEVPRLAVLAMWFVGAYAAGVLLEPLGWAVTLAGGAAVLVALPFLLYRFGPFSPYERSRVVAALSPVLLRLRRSTS
jgi:O-antigen/teichoic acid export membrane protein